METIATMQFTNNFGIAILQVEDLERVQAKELIVDVETPEPQWYPMQFNEDGEAFFRWGEHDLYLKDFVRTWNW